MKERSKNIRVRPWVGGGGDQESIGVRVDLKMQM